MPPVKTVVAHFPATILARSSSTDRSATAWAITGGIIGTLACLITIGIIHWSYFRRPRSQYRSSAVDLFGPTESPKATPLDEVYDCKSTCNSNSTTPLASPPPIYITFPEAPPPIHNNVATIGLDRAPSLSAALSYPPDIRVGIGVGFRANSPSRLQIANPDPHRESMDQLRSPHQTELNMKIAMPREEINGLKVDLEKPSSSSISATGNCTTTLAGSSSSSNQLQVQSRNSGTSRPGLIEPIAPLQDQRMPSPWTHSVILDSPPTYSPGGIDLASILAFESDTKTRA